MTDLVYNTSNTSIQPAPEVLEFFGADAFESMKSELEADNGQSLASTSALYLKHNTADGTPRKRALDDDTAEQLADGHITEEQLQQRIKERFRGKLMVRSGINHKPLIGWSGTGSKRTAYPVYSHHQPAVNHL